jgi:hypothetical protein
MTTDVLADVGPARRRSAGRLGALAGVTPLAMFGAWIAISGWGGTAGEFVRAAAEIALGSIVAGWIVGGRLGRSIAARLIGLVAYGYVAWLVLLPLNVAGSTWEELRSGQVSDPVGVVLAAGGYLLYGLVSGIYAAVFLLPFGAGWIVTFLLLRRAFQR